MQKQIKTARQLAGLAESRGKVYVRWSRSITLDRKRGHSINWAGMDAEAGLSAIEIDYQDDVVEGDAAWLARLVVDYSYLAHNGARCYVLTGRQVGTGADGETLLDASTVTVLGTIPPSVWRVLDEYSRAYAKRSATHRGVADDRPWPQVPETWSK